MTYKLSDDIFLSNNIIIISMIITWYLVFKINLGERANTRLNRLVCLAAFY